MTKNVIKLLLFLGSAKLALPFRCTSVVVSRLASQRVRVGQNKMFATLDQLNEQIISSGMQDEAKLEEQKSYISSESDSISSSERHRRFEYVKIQMKDQAISIVLVFAILWSSTLELIPSPIRLLELTYVVWSCWEYGFHRIAMHARRNSWADKMFMGYNRLHIQHHAETNSDMTMRDGFDPHGIYFSFKTTFAAFIASVFSLELIIILFQVPEISLSSIIEASSLMCLVHGIFWNRLHSDSHDVQLDFSDGLPALWPSSLDYSKGYARWLMENHIGHHDVQSIGNFNIVLPGADHCFGTYWQKGGKS